MLSPTPILRGPVADQPQHRGQRFRSGYRHSLGQDCLGSLRADHQQPRGTFHSPEMSISPVLTIAERRLPERGSPGIRLLDLGGGYLWMGSQDWRKLAWEWRPASEMVDPILYKCDVFGTVCVSCQCWVGCSSCARSRWCLSCVEPPSEGEVRTKQLSPVGFTS
jgi:hypothetical protein